MTHLLERAGAAEVPRPWPRFSDAELAARHQRVRALMRQHGLEALLFYAAGRAAEVQYLAEWPGTRESHLVFPLEGEPRLFIQLFNHLPLAQRIAAVPVQFGGPHSADAVVAFLRERDLGRASVGTVGPLPFQQYQRIREALPEVRLVEFGRPWRDLRTIKSAEEIERIRRGAAYTDDAMDALLAALGPGVTEHEVVAAIEHSYRSRGGTPGIHYLATMPMDAPFTGVPSQFSTDRVIEQGDVLISEISAGYAGYTGQVHRTYFVGCEPSREWARIHEVAVETFERVERVLRDGASLDEVLEAAEYVHQQGYTVYDDLFHGVNQYPPIFKTRRTSHSNPASYVFRENMVVVVQPNVVTEDARMGVQFGETLRITATGTERLHRTARQEFVVPA